jgi:dTDP-4-dehydrorhamnose reductase
VSGQTILVTGATGLLGPYLCETMADAGRVIGVARRNAEAVCDIEDTGQLANLLAQVRPDIVIHAAAMTDVDVCETEPDRAFRLHSQAVGDFARLIKPDARLIVVSTDQVYPDVPGPHREAGTGPVNVYGRSKLAGEALALARPGSLVVRTNFFGPSRTPSRSSLSDWMTAAMTESRPVSLFDDALFSPLHLTTLVGLLVEMVARQIEGVFNLGCRDGRSKSDFGLALAAHLGLSTRTVTVRPSTTVEGRVARARDLRMDVAKVEQQLSLRLPTLQQEIEKL